MSSKARSKLTLERVLGLTACSNSGLSVNHVTGDVAYPAGCVVVMYNFRRDKQTRYYRVERAVSAVAFSPDGKLLAIAEKGHEPSITVWDVETGQLKAEFKKHKYGVVALAFSADARYLVSVGFVFDKMLYAWDLATNMLVGGAIIEDKIFALEFSAAERYFVTVGHRHVHFWPLDAANALCVTGRVLDDHLVELQSTAAKMARLTDATFVDVGCGTKTVAVTSDGFLCCFGGATMERLVSLEASCGFALSVTAEFVAVAGSAATIRLFDPVTLEYKHTLPFPPPYGKANEPNQFQHTLITPERPAEYAAAMAVRLVGGCLVALYADHTLLVFEVPSFAVLRTFLFHHGPIGDLQMVGAVVGMDTQKRILVSKTSAVPDGAFVTCSDDQTVRFWHLDRHKQKKSVADWTNPYCPEVLHIVYGATTAALDQAVPDPHIPKETHDVPHGFKCLALSDTTMAVGTNHGDIHFVSLQWPDLPRRVLEKAHASGVLTVAYSSSGQLASGGRDRLTHVYDRDGVCMKTLENHSGAVSVVRFTADGKRLISAGADHNLVFTQVSEHRLFRYNSFPVKGGKIHSMAVVDNDYVVSCVNSWVDVHTLVSNKHVHTHAVGEHHQVELSPGSALMALGGSTHDKCIYIVDFQSGDVLAKAAGHGDAITGLKFTLDGRRLVSASSDGCIFVWRLSDDLQSALKAKIRGVPSTVVIETLPEVPKPIHAAAPPPPLMPPPAPPGQPKKLESKIPKPHGAWYDGKAVAVPGGPLANADLDTWMKTRNVPRFHAPDDAGQLEEPLYDDTPSVARHHSETPPLLAPDKSDGPVPDAILNKDLVPSWARTIRQPSTPASNTSVAVSVGRKWAVLATPDPLNQMPAAPSEEKPHELDSNATRSILKDDRAVESNIPDGEWATHGIDVETKELVPSWARTFKEPSPSTSLAAPSGKSKWGAPGVVDSLARCDDDDDDDDELEMSETLYIKQSNGELHELEVPVSTKPSSPSSLMRQPSSSWSLAHERELLNKKKKQQETANAVAEMQAKLGLLGILKPKAEKPKAIGASFVTAYKDEILEDKSETKTALADEPPPPQVAVDASTTTTKSTTKAPVARRVTPPAVRTLEVAQESIDLVDKSLSHFVSGYAEATQTPLNVTQSVDTTIPVDQSLSHFVSGYGNLDRAMTTTPTVYREVPLSPKTQAPTPASSVTSSLDTTPVDMSLSHFTFGYDNGLGQSTRATDSTRSSVGQSVDLTTVDISLSHFVSGYNQDVAAPPATKSPTKASPAITPNATQLSVQQSSVDFTPVDASLGQFVAGYHGQAANVAHSIDTTPVDASLGQFVSGYSEQVQSVVQSIDTTPVDASLGQFVAGYHAQATNVAQSIDATPVDASLSQFVSGYSETSSPPSTTQANLTTKTNTSREGAPPTPPPSPPQIHRTSESLNSTSDSALFTTASMDMDMSLSQYISGYATAVDLATVHDIAPASSVDLSDTSDGDSSDESQLNQPGEVTPVTLDMKQANPRDPSSLLEAEDGSPATASPEKKTIVRSLRHLEVNLETTVRQLADVHPGDDPDDEIVALATALQAKIARFAEKP
ncbi:Aste57867_21552 [Aphanomyces stellatus]|uniref:Aste57867_21552 protein n=1 Tax=Aphanomyces stellatus TaxID=120398 RepID=A0A485LJ37_9STRA|nr:hypothetical protein As57867_021483 [Aphanomyces stellatus]VFT98222.1 Aste57867_21552 [Aphanomyces stellatus]